MRNVLFSIIVLVASLTNASAQSDNPVSVKADLNGDGKADTVTLSIESGEDGALTGSSKYVLQVNDSIFRDIPDGILGDLRIEDIYTEDKYKEIILRMNPDSENPFDVIYSYDGKKVAEMVLLEGIVGEIYNGNIYVDCNKGFWTKTEKYKLNNKLRKLIHIPQDYYFVGLNIITTEAFAIYNSPEEKKELAVVESGEFARILVCRESKVKDSDDWYSVISKDRLLGWVKYSMIENRFREMDWDDGLLVTEADVDLDGDGKKEHVSFGGGRRDEMYEETQRMIRDCTILKIDNKAYEIRDSMSCLFSIIDLDKNDSFKEIDVNFINTTCFFNCQDEDNTGLKNLFGGNPNVHVLYSYRNGKTTKIGRMNGDVVFHPDGTIDVVDDGWLWTRTDKFKYNPETNKLDWAPKTLYKFEKEFGVRESFEIYKSPEDKTAVAVLNQGEIIKIIAADTIELDKFSYNPDCWLLIRNSKGIEGWYDGDIIGGKIFELQTETQKNNRLEFDTWYDSGHTKEISVKRDLDGDSIPEDIRLIPTEYLDPFYEGILKINNSSIEVGGEWFYVDIVDIDVNDGIKELDVDYPGPSADDSRSIYFFNDESIIEIGSFKHWPQYPGNGKVFVDKWWSFWSEKQLYVLDKQSHKLQEIPQVLAYLGIRTVVMESFPLVMSPDNDTVLATLGTGTSIEILACATSYREDEDNDIDYWYLIKSEKGICGWATERTYLYKLLLDSAD